MKKVFLNILAVYSVIWMVIFALVSWKTSVNPGLIFFYLPILFYFIVRFLPGLKALKIPLIIYGFFFTALLMISDLGFIKSSTDLLLTVLIFPIFLYFVFLFVQMVEEFRLIRMIKKVKKVTVAAVAPEEPKIKEEKRRRFLKLAASAGLGTAILYLINPKKASGAFFGSIPGPGTIAVKDSSGVKIDPAIKSPTDGYGVMNTISSGNYPYYYGFVNKDGAWYILKEVGDGSFLYAKGVSGYDWSLRTSQTYASFDTTF